jgi:gamma-glutamylputrescine oxidase
VTPYWLDGVSSLAGPLEGEVTADIVVIGAGLCGASAAYAAARAGVSVVWLEGGAVCHGASGRNAGFLLQGTAERYVRAVAIHGRAEAREVHALTRENHEAMAAVVAELGIDCGYKRRGSLQLASSLEEEGDLLESAAMLQADGFAAVERRADALGPALSGAGFRFGVLLPEDGELDPARFVRGVARASMAEGVRLYEHTPVLELDAPAPGDVTVRTPNGRVRAQLALVCTNARVAELVPGLTGCVDPVRGQMLATGPAPATFDCPIYADHGFDYWRQDEHGRIALGGWRNLDPESEVGTDEALHPVIQARMTEFLQRFPSLRDVPITHRWSGTMGFSRDGLPIVGAAPGMPGALVAAGFTGHGFGFAWVCGRALAELVTDGHSRVAELLTSRRMR